MNEVTHEIRYGCIGPALFIRFLGEGTRDTCRAANGLVSDFLDIHTLSPDVMLDLRECGWVDSTFAGWMIGLNKRLSQADGEGALRVVGWSDECREALARMNLAQIFEPAPSEPPRHLRVLTYPPDKPPDRASLELMAAAHRELADLDDDNCRVFGPIADMLEAQLAELPG